MPLVKGGQGRTARDLESTAVGFLGVVTLCAAVLLVAWLVWP